MLYQVNNIWKTKFKTKSIISIYICVVTIAATVTTPLDVIKTRIMLAHASQKRVKILTTMKEVYREKGIKG